jgi:hypothetical protein
MKGRLAVGFLLLASAVAGWVTFRGPRSRADGKARASEQEGGRENEGRALASSAGRARDPSSRRADEDANDAPAANAGLPVLDRAKRDAIRTLIWESFGQEPPDAAPPPKPTYVLPDTPPWPEGSSFDGGPGIEPKYIQQAVRSDFFPLARKCYADMNAPDAGGTVVLAFDIVGNANIGGIVEQVDVLSKSTLVDPGFVDCMRQSFLSVSFPPPAGGGMVEVEYPIIFSPGDEDGDD